VQIPLSPQAALNALTDFGPHRAEVWPNIDVAHFQVHKQDVSSAEVTEGSAVVGGAWERERYTWDAAAGTVAVETIDSNIWGPGSRWDYRIKLGSSGGSEIEVTVVRNGKTFKGRLIELAFILIGTRQLATQIRGALARAGSIST